MSKDQNLSAEEQARIATQQASVNAHLPPDALELLRDRRMDTLREWPAGLTIQPAQPVRTDCAYLHLERGYESQPSSSASWVNQPPRFIGFGGLEDLQRVFLEEKQSRPDWHQHETARRLAEALVIVKFQRFLQSARAHMKQLKCPLLASAHDYVEFVVELPAAP